MKRRGFARSLAGAAAAGLFVPPRPAEGRDLPFSTVFKGTDDFARITAKAMKEGWASLPIGSRMVRVGRELQGRPYQSFTLEIDDRIEAPSVNLRGLDCWTFFEICLGFGRMLGWRRESYQPGDLLREIEFTRYRGGACHGDYLDRIHYLAEWFVENEARGVADEISRELGGAQRIQGRKISEMTTLWKSYRYLRNNPDLLPEMGRHERRVEKLPVYYIPKSGVAGIERKLQDGDIAGIATRHDGGFCSHVGLIVRTRDGVARFFHASRDEKKVIVDSSISGYLNRYSKHAGVIIARPKEVSSTITDPSAYRRNLAGLTRG